MGYYEAEYGFYSSSGSPSKNVYMAAWDTKFTYQINTVVSYNGSLYKSKTNPNQGNTPTDVTNWDLILPSGAIDLVGDVIDFDFSSVSPVLIGKSPTGLSISNIIIEIITPFNNPATTITAGDAGDHTRLFPANLNDPTTAENYEAEPNYIYAAPTDMYLYITGVSTAGAGRVRLYFN